MRTKLRVRFSHLLAIVVFARMPQERVRLREFS